MRTASPLAALLPPAPRFSADDDDDDDEDDE